jgi:NitT/TauT family transport system ATP-binding protein
MRKRASLARTLVYRPETLLLDEPFSALDAQMRVVLQRQLKQIVRELGLTVLLVTHDLAEAVSLADRVVVFSRRPARIIDIVDVPASPERDVLRRAAGDDEIQARLWSLLAEQIDIDAAR